MQATQSNHQNTLTDFHAVEYMREVRTKHAEKYKADPQRYVEDAQKAMEAFKQLLKKPAANSGFASAGGDE